MIVTVPSHDVQVGDTVTFLGTPHLITSIEEHPSAISDTGTIPPRPTTTAGVSRSTASSAVVASTSRPASAGQRRDLDLVAGVVAGLGTVAIVPGSAAGTGTRRPDPSPGGLVGSPLPVCHSARVERGPTGRPGPASLVVT